MLRREFCQAAGAATGWLLLGGFPRLAYANIAPNEIALQVATNKTFDIADIIFEVVGDVKTKDYDNTLPDGQTLFWRQAVWVEDEFVTVYHGRLTDERFAELLDLYGDELSPFIIEVGKKPKKPKKPKKDEVEESTGKTLDASLPERFDLGQNYPNPFRGRTTVPVYLPEPTQVEVTVFDSAGRQVSTIVNSVLRAGTHLVEWTAEGLPSGTYTVVMRAGGLSRSRQLVLIR